MDKENKDQKSWPEQPDIAVNPHHGEKECINGNSLSINCFHGLKMRDLCNKMNYKPPNIFREYHLQMFKFSTKKEIPLERGIREVVIENDMICVVYATYIIPFERHPAGEISAFKSENGEAIKLFYLIRIDFVCYNRIDGFIT